MSRKQGANGGYCGPFDMSILVLLVGMVLISLLWEENYGSNESGDSGGALENLTEAGRLLRTDKNMLLVGFACKYHRLDVRAPTCILFGLFSFGAQCSAHLIGCLVLSRSMGVIGAPWSFLLRRVFHV